jgi:hypothetical protein
MIVKLTDRDGRDVFLNTSKVLLAEETANGWEVTVDALALARIVGPRSQVYSGNAVVSRVLEFDHAGAAPLIKHLDYCQVARMAP